MSKLPILSAPDPILATEASPVARVDDTIRKQFDDMLETMLEAPGIGLAANQVGILNRVIVMQIESEDISTGPLFLANPEVIWESEVMSTMEEGCLSVPGHYADVIRPEQVRVKYLDYNGKEQELSADGLLSHCVQHEIDHLDGTLFVDHISRLKRNMIIKKLEKIKKSQEIL